MLPLGPEEQIVVLMAVLVGNMLWDIQVSGKIQTWMLKQRLVQLRVERVEYTVR